MPALASPAVIKHLTSLGVNAIELMPVHQTAPERRLEKLGLTNYWGYNSIGYFAPDVRFASGKAPRWMRRGIQSDGEGVSPRGNRGDPRRRLQPYRRRGRDRADDLLSRNRQRHLLPARRRRAALRGFHRHRQLARPTHSPVLQMVMDSLRYWSVEMHVDGFRFDLATTLARGPRGEFGGQPVFRRDRAGPGAIDGQADRGAVGRRRGRLSRREFSGQLERVERQVPRRRARFLARRERFDGRVCVARHRQFGLVPRRRARAAREHQLCHLARRLHAHRPRFVQREAQRGERRGQPRRRQTTIDRGIAASKGRPTIPRFARFASSRNATSSRR